MTAGYSGTPLARKLGIRAGDRVLLERAPDGFRIDDLPERVQLHRHVAPGPPYDVVLSFVTERARLADRLPVLRDRTATAGALWFAWPKRAAKVTTDVTEDVVREAALAGGLVDVKVCAVDEVWSGLKLVRRRRDR